MNRLLGTSLLLLCIAGPYCAGCSSSKSPASGTATATGGNGNATGGADTGPQDTTLRPYDADDPNLVYTGRIDFSDPKSPRFSAPAVYVTARFKGVSVAVKVKAVTGSTNYFDLVIDGNDTSATKIQTSSTTDWITVVPDLPYGEHTAKLVKRTEASPGQVSFQGFEFGGTILPPAAAMPHKMEIIGDSISCGSGDMAGDGTPNCSSINAYSNANLAYGPVLARQLNADVHVTAFSGIGVIRNYSCGNTNTMPVVYDRLFLEQASAADSGTNVWDTSKFKPDAILIGLGTNDFSPDDCNKPALNETVDPTNYALFISTLKSFITTLRGYYSDVDGGKGPDFFLLSSPMLNDGWPDTTYTSDTSQRAAITTVANDLNGNTTGTGKVHVFLFTATQRAQIADLGCGTHPIVSDHAKIAADMKDLVQTSMGW